MENMEQVHTEHMSVDSPEQFIGMFGIREENIPLFKEELGVEIYAHGGEIFVLDMGKPVKIDDMARKMIRLSGYTPDVDIKIVYTGLRPGEKLYEELLMDEEMVKTANDLIYIGNPIMFDETFFREKLRQLYKACEDENTDIRTLISEIIPTYRMKHEAYLR